MAGKEKTAPEPLKAEIKAEKAEAKEAPKKASFAPESSYSVEVLAANYKAFGTFREIVLIALQQAGVEKATLTEAKKIVENFKNKEV